MGSNLIASSSSANRQMSNHERQPTYKNSSIGPNKRASETGDVDKNNNIKGSSFSKQHVSTSYCLASQLLTQVSF